MRLVFGLIFCLLACTTYGQQYIEGYCRKDGTCVPGHFRSRPNDSALDNYSTAGNLNPNTGRISNQEVEIPATSGQGLSSPLMHIGPRGGQYYINENGRKVYVPKR